mgnify:CR=1 FL=1
MKEHRLAEIVRMLRGNAQVTASILADRLQVSRRTILRDLQELQRRGVPIRTECGANGGPVSAVVAAGLVAADGAADRQ